MKEHGLRIALSLIVVMIVASTLIMFRSSDVTNKSQSSLAAPTIPSAATLPDEATTPVTLEPLDDKNGAALNTGHGGAETPPECEDIVVGDAEDSLVWHICSQAEEIDAMQQTRAIYKREPVPAPEVPRTPN